MDSYSENLHVANTAADTGADTGQAPAADAAAVKPVMVAQAGTTQHVATPPAGEQVTIAVVPGTQYDFDFHQGDADFVFADGNLVILVHGGGEIILQGFGSEAAGNQIPPLNFAGDTIGAFDLLSQTASAEQLADIQPAAGPAGGAGLTGGAAFSPFDPGPLPPSIPGIGPIPPTALAFLPPELIPFVFPSEELPGLLAVLPEEECVNPCADELAAFFADVPHLEEGPPPNPDDFNSDPESFSDQWVCKIGCVTVGTDGDDFIDNNLLGKDGVVGGEGNDWILGSGNNEALVGDQLGGIGPFGGYCIDGFAGPGETNYNDTIFGGEGSDTVVGDVLVVHGTNVNLGAGTFSEGGDVNAFNDYLSGGAGSDTLVGDVMQTDDGHVELNAFGEGLGTVYAFNDTLWADDAIDPETGLPTGAGFATDLMVGDVYQTGGECGGATANLDAVSYGGANIVAYNDYLNGGGTIVGDVYQTANKGDLEADLHAYGFGDGGATPHDVFAFNDYIVGGDQVIGGQRIIEGPGEEGGEQDGCAQGALLVGDVAQDGFAPHWSEGNDADLSAEALGAYGYGGFTPAENQNICAFDDNITGGDQTVFFNKDGEYEYGHVSLSDTIVGDVYQNNESCKPSGEIRLTTFIEGDSNIISSFSDTMTGGADIVNFEVPSEASASSTDVMVGDAMQINGQETHLYAGAFGDGNEVYAYMDTIIGGSNVVNVTIPESVDGGELDEDYHYGVVSLSDTLVGDVYQDGGNSTSLFAEGSGNGNHFCVYSDLIVSGATSVEIVNNSEYGGEYGGPDIHGGDLLVGDALVSQQDPYENHINFGVSNFAGGESDANGNFYHAFSDTIIGGALDDTIVGDLYSEQFAGCDAANNVELDTSNKAYKGSTANGNEIGSFNDVIVAGEGNNQLTGDVRAEQTAVGFGEGDCAEGNSENNSSIGGGSSSDGGAGGDGGDGVNSDGGLGGLGGLGGAGGGGPSAGGEGACASGDGVENSNDIDLTVVNGAFSEGVADGNVIGAHNDTMVAGSGFNSLIGDVAADMGAYGGGGNAYAFGGDAWGGYGGNGGSGGDGGYGGDGGDGSYSHPAGYNGGAGANGGAGGKGGDGGWAGGGVAYGFGGGAYNDNDLTLDVSNVACGSGEAGGNTINAFNDSMVAGGGEGFFVGDVAAEMFAGAEGGNAVAIGGDAYGGDGGDGGNGGGGGDGGDGGDGTTAYHGGQGPADGGNGGNGGNGGDGGDGGDGAGATGGSARAAGGNAGNYNYTGLSASNDADNSSSANSNVITAFSDTMVAGGAYGGGNEATGDAAVFAGGFATGGDAYASSGDAYGGDGGNGGQGGIGGLGGLAGGKGNDAINGPFSVDGVGGADGADGAGGIGGSGGFAAVNHAFAIGGDAWNSNRLDLSAGNSAYDLSSADTNLINAFNDVMTSGGEGNDFTGDVAAYMTSGAEGGDACASGGNATGGDAGTGAAAVDGIDGAPLFFIADHVGGGNGGTGPDGNDGGDAHDNAAQGGYGGSATGGDAYGYGGRANGYNNISLEVTNSASSGSSADGNHSNAFNDTMVAGGGEGFFVGDVSAQMLSGAEGGDAAAFGGDATGGTGGTGGHGGSGGDGTGAGAGSSGAQGAFGGFGEGGEDGADASTGGAGGAAGLEGDVYGGTGGAGGPANGQNGYGGEDANGGTGYGGGQGGTGGNGGAGSGGAIGGQGGSATGGDAYGFGGSANAGNDIYLGVSNSAEYDSTANTNTLAAFNDVMVAGGGAYGGGNFMVGDAYVQLGAASRGGDAFAVGGDATGGEGGLGGFGGAGGEGGEGARGGDGGTGGFGGEGGYGGAGGDAGNGGNGGYGGYGGTYGGTGGIGGSADGGTGGTGGDAIGGTGGDGAVGGNGGNGADGGEGGSGSAGGNATGGDAYGFGGSAWNNNGLELDVSNSAYEAQANGNTFAVANDTMTADGGFNEFVGDVAMQVSFSGAEGGNATAFGGDATGGEGGQGGSGGAGGEGARGGDGGFGGQGGQGGEGGYGGQGGDGGNGGQGGEGGEAYGYGGTGGTGGSADGGLGGTGGDANGGIGGNGAAGGNGGTGANGGTGGAGSAGGDATGGNAYAAGGEAGNYNFAGIDVSNSAYQGEADTNAFSVANDVMTSAEGESFFVGDVFMQAKNGALGGSAFAVGGEGVGGTGGRGGTGGDGGFGGYGGTGGDGGQGGYGGQGGLGAEGGDGDWGGDGGDGGDAWGYGGNGGTGGNANGGYGGDGGNAYGGNGGNGAVGGNGGDGGQGGDGGAGGIGGDAYGGDATASGGSASNYTSASLSADNSAAYGSADGNSFVVANDTMSAGGDLGDNFMVGDAMVGMFSGAEGGDAGAVGGDAWGGDGGLGGFGGRGGLGGPGGDGGEAGDGGTGGEAGTGGWGGWGGWGGDGGWYGYGDESDGDWGDGGDDANGGYGGDGSSSGGNGGNSADDGNDGSNGLSGQFGQGGDGGDAWGGNAQAFGGDAWNWNVASLEATNNATFGSASGNSFSVANDIMIAGGGAYGGSNDLIGDVFVEGMVASARGGDACATGGDAYGGNVGGSILLDAAEPAIDEIPIDGFGGEGGDAFGGNACAIGGDATNYNVVGLWASNSAEFGDANGNTISAFNDTMSAGGDYNYLVGDVGAQSMGAEGFGGDANASGGDAHGGFGGGPDPEEIILGGEGSVAYGGNAVAVGGDVNNQNVIRIGAGNYAQGGSYNGFGNANGNSFRIANDVLTAAGGNNVLVGDVLAASMFAFASGGSAFAEGGDASAEGTAYGGCAAAFGGDVWNQNEIGLSVENSAESGTIEATSQSGTFADGNTFTAFNDTMSAGEGDNVMVGDVWAQRMNAIALPGEVGAADGEAGSILDLVVDGGFTDNGTAGNLNTVHLGLANFAGGSNAHADGNSFSAFNDILTAGDSGAYGGNLMVGDVFVGTEGCGEGDGMRILSGGFESGWNRNQVDLYVVNTANDVGDDAPATANGNGFTAFNDTMTSGDAGAYGGGNVLVGDVLANRMAIYSEGETDDNRNDIDLRIANSAFAANGGASGVEANGNTFNAFNDIVVAGDGGNFMAGDVAAGTSSECNTGMNITSYGDEGYNVNEIDLSLRNLALGDLHRAYAEGNSFTAFNDVLVAGTGNNTVVGDVYALMQINDHGKGDSNTDVNRIELGASNVASQSAHASGNSFDAFNDTMTAGDSGAYGGNLMVGDVYAEMGIAGGDNTLNEVNLYLKDVEQTQINDKDVASDNDFTAFNDSLTSGDGFDRMAGDVALFGTEPNTITVNFSVFNDGDNNSFVAFNDTLSGGAGNDGMVGDVYMSGADNSIVNVNVTDNGSGNSFDLFNDTLTGGLGDDTMVGDAWLGGSNFNLTVNGGDGDDTLFSDLLVGGDGNDQLYGDFLEDDALGGGSDQVDTNISTDGGTLFADTLDGGTGNDLLVGGLGSDLLTGGAGNDTFEFNNLDEAGDTITSGDFQTGLDKVDIVDVLNDIGNGNTEGQDWQVVDIGGGDSELQVSTDNGTSWTSVVTVLDATLLSTDIVT
jgi:hypothetical protein